MSAPTPAEYVPLPALPPSVTGELPQKKSDPLRGMERSTPEKTFFQVGAKPIAMPAALSVAQPSFLVLERPAATSCADPLQTPWPTPKNMSSFSRTVTTRSYVPSTFQAAADQTAVAGSIPRALATTWNVSPRAWYELPISCGVPCGKRSGASAGAGAVAKPSAWATSGVLCR